MLNIKANSGYCTEHATQNLASLQQIKIYLLGFYKFRNRLDLLNIQNYIYIKNQRAATWQYVY